MDGQTAERTNRLARPASKSSVRRARREEEIAFSRVGRCVVPWVKCETGIPVERTSPSPKCAWSERKEGKRKKGRRATKVK